jgi:hypothetical protein
MIANPAIPNPAAVPRPFTLNDLRLHTSISQEPSSTPALPLYGLALAVALAIGVFIWLDPMRLFAPTEASPPARAIIPFAEPRRPIERLNITAPPTPVPATNSVEMPIAPAPVVQAPHVSTPVVRPRPAIIKPESRGNQMDKTNTTVLQASPKETNAPAVLLTKPEETPAPPVLLNKPEDKTDAPIVLKPGEEGKNAPKPAATSDQTPVRE